MEHPSTMGLPLYFRDRPRPIVFKEIKEEKKIE